MQLIRQISIYEKALKKSRYKKKSATTLKEIKHIFNYEEITITIFVMRQRKQNCPILVLNTQKNNFPNFILRKISRYVSGKQKL